MERAQLKLIAESGDRTRSIDIRRLKYVVVVLTHSASRSANASSSARSTIETELFYESEILGSQLQRAKASVTLVPRCDRLVKNMKEHRRDSIH